MHSLTQKCKMYLLKIPRVFDEIHWMSLRFPIGEGWTLKIGLVSAQAALSSSGDITPIFTDLRVHKVWNMFHSQGEVTCFLLLFRMAPTPSLGSAVYQVVRCLTLVIQQQWYHSPRTIIQVANISRLSETSDYTLSCPSPQCNSHLTRARVPGMITGHLLRNSLHTEQGITRIPEFVELPQ